MSKATVMVTAEAAVEGEKLSVTEEEQFLPREELFASGPSGSVAMPCSSTVKSPRPCSYVCSFQRPGEHGRGP